MARALKPSVAAPSKDQAENLFAESEHAIEMLKSSLEDLAASQSFAEEAAKRPVPQLVDRFLLSGALNTHLADAKAHLSKGRTVFNATDVPKVIQAGRQAYADADRHRKIVGLLGALTSASRTLDADIDGHYHNFQALLANDYRDFASRENYPQEADAYSDLQKIFARLGELRIAPRLANRNICAVAGGFSSGKSSFLNALIGKKILPTHIDPTTSIPTYIFHVDGTSRVDAFNHYGGDVEIDAGVFKEMTHDFKRNHKIELKRLVHRVSIYTQALSSWANLALIDTPGYSNPEDGRVSTNGGTGQRDEDIALANVLKSQFLIWVVDCENGTLPEQDIHFIRKFVEERLGETQDNLYLVLNKAEKKGENDRRDVLQVAEKTAKSNQIPFAGIGVYSAHRNEWYAHCGLSFDAFLRAVDQAESTATTGLESAVAEVFQRYIDYHEQEERQLAAAVGLLNRLSELTSRDGLEKLDADLKRRHTYLRDAASAHEELRGEAQQLQTLFSAAVKGFVEGLTERRTTKPKRMLQGDIAKEG